MRNINYFEDVTNVNFFKEKVTNSRDIQAYCLDLYINKLKINSLSSFKNLPDFVWQILFIKI